MILYIATGVVFLLLLLSIWRDSRSLLNPALLIISLLFALVSVIQLSYLSGNSNSYMLALMVCFLGIPFLIFLSGIFLVYNGIVLLKREGKSKANFLSLIMGILIFVFFGVIFGHMGAICIFIRITGSTFSLSSLFILI